MFQHFLQKDGRKPSHSGFKFSVGADVESLAWDPHSEHSFVVSARIMFVINAICVEALFALVCYRIDSDMGFIVERLLTILGISMRTENGIGGGTILKLSLIISLLFPVHISFIFFAC